MTSVAVSVSIVGNSSAPAFDPEAMTGLLAWYDFSQGKTGDPVTAVARRAGTGLTDLSTAAGPDDETDHVSFEIAGTEHLDGGTVANYTPLHRDGFVVVALVRFDATSGIQTLFDNCSRNASGGRNGVALYQNGTNMVAVVSNGSGTFHLSINVGPSYASEAPTAGNWAVVEFGWEPDIGGYVRVNGGPPTTANPVGSPASGNPLYVMCFGATSSGIGAISNWQGGDDAHMFFTDSTALADRSEINSLVEYIAATQSVTLDSGGEFISGAAVDTVLV